MNYFKKLDAMQTYLNLIDLFKIKTFLWLQYLHNDKKLIFEFYQENEFYFDNNYNKLDKIELYKLCNNKRFNNYLILFLKYNNYMFVYRIIIDDIINNEEEIFNINDFSDIINNNNNFIYKDIINFSNKIKNESCIQYRKERIFMNIKTLLNDMRLSKLSITIKEKEEKNIQILSLDCTKRRNNMDESDIFFFFLYIPEYFFLIEKKI